MKKLEIKTRYHEAVQLLLMHLDLVEGKAMENVHEGLVIDYPNDCLSQELVFWLAMAQGCGLVESYQFEANRDTIESIEAKLRIDFPDLGVQIDSLIGGSCIFSFDGILTMEEREAVSRKIKAYIDERRKG